MDDEVSRDDDHRRAERFGVMRNRPHRRADVIAALPPETVVGFLVWGDPAFYDSTIRIVDAVAGPAA